MVQSQTEGMSFDQVIELVDQLNAEERKQVGRWLDFKSWDEAWDGLKQELSQTREAQGLPPPTDEEIHDEIDARRTPEQLEALRREIQIGIDSADRGECVDAEQVFEKLRLQAEQRKSEPTKTTLVFKFAKALSKEERNKLRAALGKCW